MQTHMNQSNECKQHTLLCIHQMPVPNQSLQIKSILTTPMILNNTHEESQPKPHQLPQETHKQNLTEKLFLKNGVS